MLGLTSVAPQMPSTSRDREYIDANGFQSLFSPSRGSLSNSTHGRLSSCCDALVTNEWLAVRKG
jgi:hypothetical protein